MENVSPDESLARQRWIVLALLHKRSDVDESRFKGKKQSKGERKKKKNSSPDQIRVVLPDKIPLPSLVSRVDKKSVIVENVALKPSLPADVFLANVFLGTIESWGHQEFLRCIFELLLEHGRKDGKELIFLHLQKVEKEHFHLTLAMFWVCVWAFVLSSVFLKV